MATKKKKIEYNFAAMFLLMCENPRLQNIFRDRHLYHFNAQTISMYVHDGVVVQQMNGRASLAIRQILRSDVEGTSLEPRYRELLEKVKLQEDKDLVEEFEVKITGSGTKKNVIGELENIIFLIKNSSIQELRNGQEWESNILMTETTEPHDVE